MSSYSEFVKKGKERELERFFPEYKKVTNKYFTFRRLISNDEVIIVTNNIITVKGNPVLVVGNNKVVYLKDFNIKPVHNYYSGINAYAVRLKREYFRIYTFKKDIEDFCLDKDLDFDDMVEIAKKQDERNMQFALGTMS
jgi:hypothetical protein